MVRWRCPKLIPISIGSVLASILMTEQASDIREQKLLTFYFERCEPVSQITSQHRDWFHLPTVKFITLLTIEAAREEKIGVFEITVFKGWDS